MAKKEINFFQSTDLKEVAKTVGKGLAIVGVAIVASSAINAFTNTQKE